MGWSAFQGQGNTYAIAVTTTASAAVQIIGQANAMNYLVTNSTSQAAFLAYGNNANLLAVIPVAGTPANGMYLPPNSIQSFTFTPGAWVSVITPAATTTVYITPGDGL